MKAPKPRRVSEKEVGLMCDQLAGSTGWIIERFEQSRPTMIALGLPDRRYIHWQHKLRLWCEVKAPDGKLTAAQHAWLTSENRSGGLAIVVTSPQELADAFDIARAFRPVSAAEKLQDQLDAFANRGFRPTPPKRSRRARLPR